MPILSTNGVRINRLGAPQWELYDTLQNAGNLGSYQSTSGLHLPFAKLRSWKWPQISLSLSNSRTRAPLINSLRYKQQISTSYLFVLRFIYLSDSPNQFCLSVRLLVSMAFRMFSFAYATMRLGYALPRHHRLTLYNMTSSVLQKEPHLCCNTSLIVSTYTPIVMAT